MYQLPWRVGSRRLPFSYYAFYFSWKFLPRAPTYYFCNQTKAIEIIYQPLLPDLENVSSEKLGDETRLDALLLPSLNIY